LVSIMNARLPVTLDNIHTVFKMYGDVLKIVTFVKDGNLQALVQMGTVDSAVNAKLLLEGKDMFQGCCTLRIAFSSRQTLSVQQQGAKSRDYSLPAPPVSASAAPQWMVPSPPIIDPWGQVVNQGVVNAGVSAMGAVGMGAIGGAVAGESPVVLVNKIPERITPDMLFNLFGVYGDVVRVKILFNKRDTAMVQFSNPQQAQSAIRSLNNCPLYGKQIVVSASKNFDIKMPTGEQDQATLDLTKDYSGSPLHRYRNGQMKNVNPPSQVLHLSNIYEGCGEAELVQLFQSVQTDPPLVEFFVGNHKMAYVRMDSIASAVAGLIVCHNHKLGNYNIRVSFTQKDPSSMGKGDVDESKSQPPVV